MRTRLAPDLFDRRFDDLLAIARAQIPSIAPEWTDHNTHDPGITLIELLAWVAEAEIYSLSRMRRDERAAYAKLLGLAPHGPRPASGLIWPDRSDPIAAPATIRRSMVIADDDEIRTVKSESPTYRCTHRLLWMAGHISALRSIGADGTSIDYTNSNARGDVPFKPFGDRAGPRDVMRLEFECFDGAGLFPEQRTDAAGAYVSIGVRVDTVDPTTIDAYDDTPRCPDSPLEVNFVENGGRLTLPAVDSTQGFMRTGVILLDVSAVTTSPRSFALEFRAPSGFSRPPRMVRVDVNVLPIQQGYTVARELFTASDLPDQELTLEKSGLRFGDDAPALKLETVEAGNIADWQLRDTLQDSSPADRAFTVDAIGGRLTLGNGINGRTPLPNSQMFVTYAVCDGNAGNAARNQRWLAKSVSAVLGSNPDAVAGGEDASSDPDQRRAARRRVRSDHALVTAADIESAARSLPSLEVARAMVLAASTSQPSGGVVTLIAMRTRPGGVEPIDVPETERWIAAIERRLVPRLPLGTTLTVRAPRYIAFTVVAKLAALAGYDPATIKLDARKALAERLALVAPRPGQPQRSLGAGVSLRDLQAWLRKVEGVQRVVELRVTLATGQRVDAAVPVPPDGLPRIDLSGDTIAVVRSPRAGTMT
jgi:predicted phage baseplate assembly protein